MNRAVALGLMVCAAATVASAAGAVRFEGCSCFTPADLSRSLSLSLEYQLMHATAAPGELAPVVEHLLTAGYRNEGFPDATVTANADGAGDLAVSVVEGPRFRCGALIVTGALEQVRADELREELLPPSTNVGAGRLPGAHTNVAFTNADLRLSFWRQDLGVPFIEQRLSYARMAVSNAFARHGRFHPRFDVRLERRPAAGLADLVVAVASEGPPTTIGEIVVTGVRRDTETDIKDFLGLREGDAVTRTLIETKTAQLMGSARFIAVQLTANPPAADGRSTLRVRLIEAPGLPPLREKLSPEAQVLLRTAAWIEDWSNRDDEIHLNFNLAELEMGLPPLDLDFVSSGRRGMALAVRERPGDGGATLFALYGLATGERSLFLPADHRRYTVASSPGVVELRMSIDAFPPDAKGVWRNFVTMLNHYTGTGTPFSVKARVHPAAMAAIAYASNLVFHLEDGVLTLRDHEQARVRIDAATGRLIAFSSGTNLSFLVLTGHLDRAVADLRSLSANWPNLYDSNRPFASLASFAGPGLIRLQSILITNETVRMTPDRLARAAGALEKLWASVADGPWDGMLRNWSGSTNGLHIPPEASRLPQQVESGLMGMLAGWILADCDQMAPAGSWPSALLRAQAFRMSGQSRLVAAEMTRIARMPGAGPLALQQCSSTAADLDPRFARQIATLALARMSTNDFMRDLEPLLDDRALLGELVVRLAHTLSVLDDDEVAALADLLPEEPARAFSRFMKTLRADRPPGFGDRLAAALTGLWRDGEARAFEQKLRDHRNRLNARLVGVPPPAPGLQMPAGIVDLGGVYNDWLGVIFGSSAAASNHVERLVTNVQQIAGHEFDIRGIVMAAPPGLLPGAPRRVEGIAVRRPCKRLHFLQGVANNDVLERDQNVAAYTVRYEDGSRESIEVISGQDINGSYAGAAVPAQPPAAWEIPDPRGLAMDARIRLYVQTWENPHPERTIQTIDLICWHARAAPFLVALTAE